MTTTASGKLVRAEATRVARCAPLAILCGIAAARMNMLRTLCQAAFNVLFLDLTRTLPTCTSSRNFRTLLLLAGKGSLQLPHLLAMTLRQFLVGDSAWAW